MDGPKCSGQCGDLILDMLLVELRYFHLHVLGVRLGPRNAWPTQNHQFDHRATLRDNLSKNSGAESPFA